MSWSLLESKGNEMSSLNCEVLLASSRTSWVFLPCHLSFRDVVELNEQKQIQNGRGSSVEPLCLVPLCNHLDPYFLPITLCVPLMHE